MLLDYLIYFLLVSVILLLSKLIRIYIRGSLYLDVLRLLLFFSPFFITIFFYGNPNFSIGNNYLVGFIIAIGASFIALLAQYKDFSPYFHKDFYHIVPLHKKRIMISMEISLLLSPLFEELLYRYYFPNNHLIVDSILSSLLFSAVHYLNRLSKSTLKFKDYAILFALGMSWYLSFSVSGSITPAIIGHLLYNLPNALISYLRYRIPNNLKTIQEEM